MTVVMEKSEPALVPEWLKKTGAVNGGISTDEQTAPDIKWNKSSVNGNGIDSARSFSSAKTTSSYFRRSSSSNGSARMRPRNNFGRNQHARDYDRDAYQSFDRRRSVSGDFRGKNFLDVKGNTLFSESDRNGVHHSHSVVSGKHEDTWHKKGFSDSITTSTNANGLPSKGRVSKATFEREFPPLGPEERAATPDAGRLPSPGLSSAIQCLSMSSSAIVSEENLTSVLAEIPVSIGGNGAGMSLVQQVAPSSVTSVALGTPPNLNMAEAIAQGTNRILTPQLSVETQRLEELAIKQSRQLIPMTPSMPKNLVSSSSDKHKAKTGNQQHPVSSSFAFNHSSRTNGSMKSDVSKQSNVGKLHVLKPSREKNGFTPVVKDNLSPGSGGKPVSSTVLAASLSGSAPTSIGLNGPGHDGKPASIQLEKRPSSQAKSRNDFFMSVRRKSIANASSVMDSSFSNLQSELDTSTIASASVPNNLSEIEAASAPDSRHDGDASCASAMAHAINDSDNACVEEKLVKTEDKPPALDPIFSEEEEAAFLRSLGWEENADEVALTEEEISAFFRDATKYINSNPSLKVPRVYPNFMSPFDSHIVGIGSIHSGLSSSDAKLES